MKIILKNSNLEFKNNNFDWILTTECTYKNGQIYIYPDQEYAPDGNGQFGPSGVGRVYTIDIPENKTYTKIQAYSGTLNQNKYFGYRFIDNEENILGFGYNKITDAENYYTWLSLSIPEGATKVETTLPRDTMYTYHQVDYIGTYFA